MGAAVNFYGLNGDLLEVGEFFIRDDCRGIYWHLFGFKGVYRRLCADNVQGCKGLGRKCDENVKIIYKIVFVYI